MALTPRLDLRQSQSLVMTPQLQQAIKPLQLSNLELAEFVEQELEKNPMLERDEGDHRDQDDGPSESADPPKAATKRNPWNLSISTPPSRPRSKTMPAMSITTTSIPTTAPPMAGS